MAQEIMRAMAVDSFGGPANLTLHRLPVPKPGPKEVLIRVEVAGVGEWDPFEREGGFAEMLSEPAGFPYVIGSEGAGKVVARGAEVERVAEGDSVYALGFPNPGGGFYAEYAVIDQDLVAKIPPQQSTLEAGVMAGVGITALRGLEDTLKLQKGETIAIVGASGGIGHIAVQLAKRMGARVLAIASGADGVAFTRSLGADAAIDGHRDDVLAAARALAPDGLDAALIAAGGKVAEQTLEALRDGGRAVYPGGVELEPKGRANVRVERYDAMPDADILARFQRFAVAKPFEVKVADTYTLDDAEKALDRLREHYLGKLALRIS